MTVIKDGTGKGFLAEVGSGNDLHVRALTITEISDSSGKGVAFMAEGETFIQAAASGEQTVLILINNGDTTLEIGNIFISIQTETDASRVSKVKMYIGSVTASGGTSKSAKNLNTGSVSAAETTIIENNPTITGTDSKILELYFQGGNGNNLITPFDGGITLQKNGSFRVGVTGAATITSGLTCDTSFQFWQERET